MKNLIYLILTISLLSAGCQRYVFDKKINRCRDIKTGRIVNTNLCIKGEE